MVLPYLDMYEEGGIIGSGIRWFYVVGVWFALVKLFITVAVHGFISYV